MRPLLLLLACIALSAAAYGGAGGYKSFAERYTFLDTCAYLRTSTLSRVLDTVKKMENDAAAAGDNEFEGQLKLYALIRRKDGLSMTLDSFEKQAIGLAAFASANNLRCFEAEVLQIMGDFYGGNKGRQSAAIDHYLRAYAIYKNMPQEVFPPKQAYITTLGGIYYRYEDYDNAIKYLHDALNTRQTVNNNQFCSIFNTIGMCYRNMKKYDSAIVYFRKTYDNAQASNTAVWMGISQGNIGTTYFYQKKYYQATPLLQQDIDVCLANNDIQEAVGSMGILATIYNLEGSYDSAQATLADALSIAEGMHFWPKYALAERLYTQLSRAYAAKNNYRMAWLYADSAIIAKDSVAGNRDALILAKADEKQNFLEHKLEDEELRSQVAIGKLEISTNRTEIIFTVIGIGILLVVLVFISRERKRSDDLLLNILPGKIAERLKQKEHPIADYFENASVLFVDMAGFTVFSQGRNPKEIVNMLNEIFSRFDLIAEKHGLEKIKTIGDCYMAVSGLPEPNPAHAEAATQMALEIRTEMKGYRSADGSLVEFRLGLDCGPVVAGVIGRRKFIYDLWGDTVNIASRMETTGIAGEIHCTGRFKKTIEHNHTFTCRGKTEIKGKGMMETWLIVD